MKLDHSPARAEQMTIGEPTGTPSHKGSQVGSKELATSEHSSNRQSEVAGTYGMELDELRQEREQLLHRLAVMEAEQEKLVQQLDMIMSSRSWRLTSVLRAAGASSRNGYAKLKTAGGAIWHFARKPSFDWAISKFQEHVAKVLPSEEVTSRLDRWNAKAKDFKDFFVPALLAPTSVAPACDEHPLIIMIVYSDLRIDPRVMREARALAQAGFRVKIIYPDTMSTPDAPVILDYGPGVEFRPLPRSAMSYLGQPPYMMGREFLEAVCEERPFAIHSHDLSTALIGLAAAGRLKVPCVCDFHEWYSENVTWDWQKAAYVVHPPEIRSAYRKVERLAMTRAAAVLTVCESIASELESNFSSGRRKVHVIRNIPPAKQTPSREYSSLREELGIPASKFLALWQGGTGPSRLLEPVIGSLAHYEDFVLVIRGPSLDLFGDGYRKIAEEVGAPDRLILLPPVPSQDVVAAAKGADCGIWTLPNLCKNFSYALPNKVFEYLYSGLPVLAADYPEVRRLIEGNKVGLLFNPYDPQSIARAIRRLHQEKGLTEAMRARMPELIASLDADREWQKLVALYQTLAKKGSVRSLRAMGRD